MKSSKKLFGLILVLLICFSSVCSTCFAAATEIRKSGNQLLQALSWFGYAIALIMLIFIGIKYMTGSVDAKANMKTAVVGWVVGALLVFMASTVTLWVATLANLNTGSGLANDIVNTGANIR